MFFPYLKYEQLCVDFILVLNYVLYFNIPSNLLSEVIRAEAETCFENENRYTHVTFAFDDLWFSAHKGPNNPKHKMLNLNYIDIMSIVLLNV